MAHKNVFYFTGALDASLHQIGGSSISLEDPVLYSNCQ